MTVAERQQRTLAELRRNGGDKVCVNMPGPTLEALKRLQAHIGAETRSQTIIMVIDAAAKRLVK